MRKIAFILSFFLSFYLYATEQQPLKIAVISDVHYLSTKLAEEGYALDRYEIATGRNVRELHQVLDKVVSELINHSPDILLITGDITNHGERDSHIDFVSKFTPLLERGTRIFAIPGNHDINVPDAKAYIGDNSIATTSISAEEFGQIYAPFGYGNAIKRDSASLSYLAEVNDSVWILGIDSNRYKEHSTSSISGGRILPETMSWMLDILKEATTKNILVLGMMHHGLVEHMPYQSAMMPDYLIDDWKENAKILADNGLKVIFTGHFHSNDITLLATPQGNEIYDIETGSLAGYPFPYRVMTLAGNKLDVKSYFIDAIPHNPDLQENYRKKSEAIARRVIQSKLKSVSLQIPETLQKTLVDLLVKMQIEHMKGDEKMTPEMRSLVKQLSQIVGDTNIDFDSFTLDFYPVDNFVVIEL